MSASQSSYRTLLAVVGLVLLAGMLTVEQPKRSDRLDADVQRLTLLLVRDEKLLADSPDSAKAAWDVSFSQGMLGEVLVARGQPGDEDAAFKHYVRSLEIGEKVLAANPDSPLAAFHLSWSLNKLGEFLAQRGQPGDEEAALKQYTRSLEINEKFLAAHPKSDESAVRRVCSSLDILGNFLGKRGQPGDVEAALHHYTRHVEVTEKALANNPGLTNTDSINAAVDLANSHERLANFVRDHRQPAEEEPHYRHSLDMWDKLSKANTGHPFCNHRRFELCNRLADLAEKTGQGDAKAWWQRAYDILRDIEQKEVPFSAKDQGLLKQLQAKLAGT